MKAGAIAVALAWLVGLAPAALAQEALGIDILEYGIYMAEVVTPSVGTNGSEKPMGIRNICHVMTTWVVPTKDKFHFGFRYRVKGGKPGQVVDVKRSIHFPDHSNPPASLSTESVTNHTARLRVGTASFGGWEMWKTFPGLWTFTLSVADRALAELRFTVVEKDQLRIEPDGNSTCFQMS